MGQDLASKLLGTIDKALDRKTYQELHWEGTFDEYLRIIAENPRAVRNAGFSSPEVLFTATGKLEKEGERLALRVPGLRHVFFLEGGASFAELKAATTVLNKTIRVSGKLHGSHGDRPPGMTVELFESAGDGP